MPPNPLCATVNRVTPTGCYPCSYEKEDANLFIELVIMNFCVHAFAFCFVAKDQYYQDALKQHE